MTDLTFQQGAEELIRLAGLDHHDLGLVRIVRHDVAKRGEVIERARRRVLGVETIRLDKAVAALERGPVVG